jgi:hypothetical protein
VEFYGKLVGMIDMNSVELVVTNPVAVYFYNIERLPKEQYVFVCLVGWFGLVLVGW